MNSHEAMREKPPDPRSAKPPTGSTVEGFREQGKEHVQHTVPSATVKSLARVPTERVLDPILSRVDRSHCWFLAPGADGPVHVDERLHNGFVSQHLNTKTARGACPIERGTTTTRLALFDLDSHKGEVPWPEMAGAARTVINAARSYGLQPHGFRSRGGKGIHVFFIWDEAQDARSVRAYLAAVIGSVGYASGTGGVARKQIEVFPKQDAVPVDGSGSMFILPLAGKSTPLHGETLDLLPREAALQIHWRTSEPVPFVAPRVATERACDDGDVGIAYVRGLLERLPDEFWSGDHDPWLNIVFAVHDGTRGSDAGLDLIDEYSSRGGERYKGRDHIEARWRSCTANKPGGITIATLEALVRELPAEASDFDDLSHIPSRPKRRRITLTTGKQAEVLQAIGTTLAAGANFYGHMVYGDSIVKPYMVTRRGFRGESVQSLELNHLTPGALAADLNEMAEFVRVKNAKGGSKQTLRVDCPPSLAAVFLERPEKWGEVGLPHIDRITETPILQNGELLSRPGYCEAAGAYIQAPPNVRLAAGRVAAETALQRVREWLSEFPFEGAVDESVACAAMLTAALRASLVTAPGLLIDKPEFGSGASTLAKLTHIVLTGREPAVTTADRGEEELSKAIDALQMAGASAVVIDNLGQGETLQSLALTQLLSEPYRKPRILGASRTATVACTQLVIVTGVNIGVANDLVRRFIRCRIDPRCERPQERQFKRPELLVEARAARAQILSDLYTIAAAYIASGEAVSVTRLAGFEEWSRNCAQPLVWLGMPDPIASGKSLQQDDPSRNDLAAVLRAWHAAHGSGIVTTADLLADADLFSDDVFEKLKGECRRAIESAVGTERVKDINRSVGRYLSAKRGMVADGLCLEQSGLRQGVATWRVRRLSA